MKIYGHDRRKIKKRSKKKLKIAHNKNIVYNKFKIYLERSLKLGEYIYFDVKLKNINVWENVKINENMQYRQKKD